MKNRVLFYVSTAATLIGILAIGFAVHLVVSRHAGTPIYWIIVSILFVGWLFSLGNMWRIAIGRIEGGLQDGRLLPEVCRDTKGKGKK